MLGVHLNFQTKTMRIKSKRSKKHLFLIGEICKTIIKKSKELISLKVQISSGVNNLSNQTLGAKVKVIRELNNKISLD